MSIYTKTGDKGETGLFGGSRIEKNHVKVSAYGTLDEVNAVLGAAYSIVKDSMIKHTIRHVQEQLFIVGAEIASDEKGQQQLHHKITLEDIAQLEKTIDHYEKELGPLREFIIPGDTLASSFLHMARTITRRAEREIISLRSEEMVREEIIQYVNRLSDTLFMLARAESHSQHATEVKVQNKRTEREEN